MSSDASQTNVEHEHKMATIHIEDDTEHAFVALLRQTIDSSSYMSVANRTELADTNTTLIVTETDSNTVSNSEQ